jgi:hypothetical protein
MPRRKKTEYRQALEFAVILAVLGVVFAALALWRQHTTRAAVFAGIGVGALAIAVLARPVWVAFFRIWMRLAEGMGWVMTRVILSLFYVLILTPFGLVRRLSGKPTLDTRWQDGKLSYWIDKEQVEASVDRYAKRY